MWSRLHSQPPPADTLSHHQKSWDTPVVMATLDTLLENAPDAITTARLLAASTSKSRAWLNALPISSLGLRMDNNTIRVAVGIRLGTQLCRPHMCHHCGSEVDGFGIHGLSCRWSEGCHNRHSTLNDIIFRALPAAKVPSRLEPSGIYRSDGKRPDGMSIVPWKSGSCLSGMSRAPTLLHPRTPQSQAPNQVPLLSKQRRGSAQNTVTSAQTTFSPRLY